MGSLQIIWCIAAVAIATVTASACRAQEVGSREHAKPTAYSRELRRPAASTPGTKWLGAVFADYHCADNTSKTGGVADKYRIPGSPALQRRRLANVRGHHQ